MALPEILTPSSFPCFLAGGHSSAPQSVYTELERASGYRRKRKYRTTAPRIVAVSWLLSADQMPRFYAWFENTLQAGSLSFAARVAAEGPGNLYYAATWLGPYQASPLAKGRWRVSGQLYLEGEGQSDPPGLTTMRAEFSAALTGSAKLTAPAQFAAEFVAALAPSVRFKAEFVAALE